MPVKHRPARPTHDGLLKPSLRYISSCLVPPPPLLETRIHKAAAQDQTQFTEEKEACATSRRSTSRGRHFPSLFRMVGFLPGSDGWTYVVAYKLAKGILDGQLFPPPPAPQPYTDPNAVKMPVVVDDEPVKSVPFADLPLKTRRDRKRWTRHISSIGLKDGDNAIISYGTYGDYGLEY